MQKEVGEIKSFVSMKIHGMLYSTNDAAVRAELANLRRGIGKAPGELPELWSDTLDGLSEHLYSTNGTPTRAEWAVYNALTLFSLHQQGKDRMTQPMHKDGISLGRAVRMLVKNDDDENRIKRRFDAVVTATSPNEIAHHVRGIVQLLKSEGIPLDYVNLAADIYYLQFNDVAAKVRLRWGEDYYRRNKTEKENRNTDFEMEDEK